MDKTKLKNMVVVSVKLLKNAIFPNCPSRNIGLSNALTFLLNNSLNSAVGSLNLKSKYFSA